MGCDAVTPARETSIMSLVNHSKLREDGLAGTEAKTTKKDWSSTKKQETRPKVR